jgi:penicillin-binding protein 1C
VSALLAALLLWLWPAGAKAPSAAQVRAAHRPSQAWLVDRRGEVIDELRVDFGVRRLAWTPLSEVSPALVAAVVASEDRRFAEHAGVDAAAIAAATWGRLRGAPPRGASTLSMQTVALLDPTLRARRGGRSLVQKLAQMRAAAALERRWSKDEILEVYLNRVGFRGEQEGVAAASVALFGQAPAGLGEAEASVLAALLPEPGAPEERVAARACRVARASGFEASCASVAAAAHAALAAAAAPAPPGLAPQVARELLHEPGERVATTLDARVQRLAAGALREQLLLLGARGARDGAALVVENQGGEILAWVGSAGPGSTAREVDGVRARRQAGSTLKPFLYGLAIERGLLTAASLLHDAPIELETTTGLYIPQNYDRDFKGWTSVRTALASSLNVPAVRALALVGVEAFRDRLRDLGYDLREDGAYYGFSLALGSAEVSLAEQVNATRTLVNGGRWSPLRLRADAPAEPARRVMSAEAAFIVADILADRGGRAPTFGLESPLATRGWSAVKTGTSKDMRDNWCIGASRRFTVGVWVGNFEGDSMRGVSGMSGAAPAWLAILSALEADGAGLPPEPPPGVVAAEVAFAPALEPPRREWFVAGTETHRVELADDARVAPRIVSPPDGAIVALDPDIPLANQRVLLAARTAARDHELRLDGAPLGPADAPQRWLPTPGRHVLTLGVAGSAHPLDQVSFEVRGAAR